MPALPALAVVFVGLAGPNAIEAEVQIAAVLYDEARIAATHVPPRELRSLVRRDGDSGEVVRSLHVDGVIVGALADTRRHRTLSLVVYDGDGTVKSLVEIAMPGATLSDEGLAVMRSNILDTATALASSPPRALPAEQRAAARVETATADADGDAASADEILASTAAAGVLASSDAVVEHGLRLRAALGVGLTSRTFTPGPATLRGYSASGTGTMQFGGEIHPTTRLQLTLAAEHTIAMTSGVAQGSADTTISRRETCAGMRLARGVVDIAPVVGVGRRAFSIASTDPARTPDSAYDYVVLGLAGASALGSHVAIRARVAFEPVVSGTEPTEMAFGEARRWALELGTSLDVRVSHHVFTRIAAGYQRFAWLWTAAGARGAGGAVDSYPSGTVSVGLDY